MAMQVVRVLSYAWLGLIGFTLLVSLPEHVAAQLQERNLTPEGSVGFVVGFTIARLWGLAVASVPGVVGLMICRSAKTQAE